MAKRPRYRLVIQLVPVTDDTITVRGQTKPTGAPLTLLDLRLKSLEHWASMIPVEFPKLASEQKRARRALGKRLGGK